MRARSTRAPLHGESARGELVLQVQPLEVLAVHAPRHARAVGIPGHEVVELAALAAHVLRRPPVPTAGRASAAARRLRPCARSRARRSLCIIASSIAIWLGVMNTDSSPGSLKSLCAASSVTEASARSPARRECARPRSRAACRRCSSPPRAPPARRGRSAHLGERVEESELHVVVHAELAIGRVRVLPRDHEDGVAASRPGSAPGSCAATDRGCSTS